MTADHVRRRASTTFLRALALAVPLAAAGCGRPAGPPPIAAGSACDGCGMSIEDVRFAAERRAPDGWRVYDDLGCLARAVREGAAGPAWLVDHDTRALHAADSMWVVRGSFPTPMGSGCVAFLARASADEVAAQSGGRVLRFAELAGAQVRP